MEFTEKDIARFWGKVDRRGDDECWPWLGSTRSAEGYGQFNIRGVLISAHRLMMMFLIGGNIPPGEGHHGTCVLHSCDNRWCVNPAHLRMGTQSENQREMAEKGRGRGPGLCGEKHGNHKLTAALVLEIRSHPEISGIEFSRRFGLEKSTVHKARRGTHWKHLPSATELLMGR